MGIKSIKKSSNEPQGSVVQAGVKDNSSVILPLLEPKRVLVFFLEMSFLFLAMSGCEANQKTTQEDDPLDDSDSWFDAGKQIEECDGDSCVDAGKEIKKCDAGYEHNDNGDCIDIDECESANLVCSFDEARCVNSEGSYVCLCNESYVKIKGQEKCISRYDFDGPVYNGDVVLISNESIDPYQKISITGLENISEKVDIETEKKMNDEKSPLIDLVIPLPEHLTPEHRLAPLRNQDWDNTSFYAYEVGDQKSFFEFYSPGGQITATLLASGVHCDVWVHDQEKVDSVLAVETAAEFDNAIFPMVEEYFYSPSDVDGDGKIAILIFDIEDPGLGGYFAGKDLYDDVTSNKMEIIYIDDGNTMTMNSFITHEFQHLVYYNRNAFHEENPPSTEDIWLNEGLAMAAEHVYGGPVGMRISYFNTSNTIRDGRSLLYWDHANDVMANYSLSYLFVQYLRMHANQDAGIYRKIIENELSDNTLIEQVINEYVNADISMGRFMTYFRLALLMSESQGLYGFLEEKGFEKFKPRYFTGNETELRGGSAVYMEIDSEFTPVEAFEDIKYVGIFLGETLEIDPTEDK